MYTYYNCLQPLYSLACYPAPTVKNWGICCSKVYCPCQCLLVHSDYGDVICSVVVTTLSLYNNAISVLCICILCLHFFESLNCLLLIRIHQCFFIAANRDDLQSVMLVCGAVQATVAGSATWSYTGLDGHCKRCC